MGVKLLAGCTDAEPLRVGTTMQASGGKYKGETEGVLKLPDLGKLPLEVEQVNNDT